MDPKFALKLKEAREKGIEIIAAQLSFDGKNIYYNGNVKLAEF